MEKLKLFVDAIEDRYSQVDAMQIAEALWLSQYMDSYPTQKDESPQDETPISNDALPKEVTPTVNTTQPTQKIFNPNLPKVGFDKTSNSTAYYSTYIEAYRKRTNIAQKFRKLRIKQKTTSTHEIDEERTAQYIADCGLFHPIFEETKSYQKALHLKIIIDKAPSMFLWSGRIDEFIKSFENTQIFKGVTCYELHSDEGDTPMLTRYKSNKKIPYTSVLFKREDELMLVLSDIVGKHWRSAKMLDTLALWSRYHFVAIISMLPKRMWERTPLRWGSTLLTKSKKPFPKNRDLHLEYPALENRLSNSLKIPVIPYDEDAFEHLSSVIASHKNSQIETRIFADINQKIKSAQTNKNTPQPPLTPKDRVENFFASAPPSARALAIYTSVLPLHERIIKELIKLKKLGRGIDAFAEFYFGGLLKGGINAKVGTYQFHDGVAKILREYITLEDARELFWMLDGVIKSSLGVARGLIDLLYIDKSTTTTDCTPQEKALVELLIEILGDMGHQSKELEDTINPSDTILPPTKSFLMGSNERNEEKPIHKVTINYDFEIGKYPVTVGEFRAFVDESGYITEAEKGDGAYVYDGGNWKEKKDASWKNPYFDQNDTHPVVCVSWNDAVAYCKWLSQKTGESYRLPTEAEWEYACRAGTTTRWSFGDDEKELEKYAWYDKNSEQKTHPVGEKLPNPWGLHDMHGNVWEWCEDDWVDSYEKAPRDGTAHQDKSSSRKVLRGGSWISYAEWTRSSFRDWFNPSSRYYGRGFRLLRTYP